MSTTITCDSAITITTVSGVDVPTCSSGWVQSLYILPFDPAQIDPMIATELFVAGFLLFVTPWAFAWGLKQLIRSIRGSL